MTRLGDSDLEVFPLTLGGNVFGWTASMSMSFEILDAFVVGGGNFVDTADSYSAWVPGHHGGESEEIIGAWLQRRGRRDDVVIATKVAKHPRFPGLAATNIHDAVDASLRRLKTDYVDLYYAHEDDPGVPLEEFVGTLSTLVDAGKVRHLGISNFTPERIEEWFAVSQRNGLHRAVALQPRYSLVERGFETSGLREAAMGHQLSVLPYSALANGFLTGKYRREQATPRSDARRVAVASSYLDARGDRVLSALDELASEHQVSVTTVSLAWLLHQPAVSAPVASVTAPDQIADLLASATLRLSADEVAALSSASERDGARE